MAYPADYRAPFQPDLDGVLLANSEHNQPQQVINRYRNSLHFVASPKPDIKIWLLCKQFLHHIRSVQISRCFT